MAWNGIIGQERVKSLLKQLWERGRLPHAMLFHGPEGAGKDAVAIELARVLNCEGGAWEACGVCQSCLRIEQLRHPRLRLVFALPSKPEESTAIDKFSEAELAEMNRQIDAKAENPYCRFAMPKASGIKISSIRDVRHESAFRSAAAGRSVVLISEADRMNNAASNALLKTLEEPTGDTMLILTTAKREAMLPTILSRCQQVRFDPLAESDIAEGIVRLFDVPPEKAVSAAQLANGSVTEALSIAGGEAAIPRETIRLFLRAVCQGKPAMLMEHIRKIADVDDKKAVALFLVSVASWFRDVLAVQEGAEDRIRNTDLGKPIMDFAGHFPDVRCSEAVDAIETAIDMIIKNVHLVTILIVLSHRLRRCIMPRT
ncbi:MAG: AAA family ATPase [Ignavibacteria bacterium]|nr:AAA family ATPase [Ignavibacteria bacterium]